VTRRSAPKVLVGQLAGLLALLLWGAARAQAQVPAVDFVIDARADEACAVQRHYTIRPEWTAELQSRLPELRDLWAAQGPALLDAVRTVSGKPLAPQPLTVRLTLCDTPSQSITELAVNMRYALRSFTPQPVPLRYKLDTALHEILHAFVTRHTPPDSPLLARHARENACVRNHLHLLALQKAVLLQTGDRQALQQVVDIDGQLPSGCYRRAWSLVSETDDGYRAYVAELSAVH
jgi:hypothetical protein